MRTYLLFSNRVRSVSRTRRRGNALVLFIQRTGRQERVLTGLSLSIGSCCFPGLFLSELLLSPSFPPDCNRRVLGLFNGVAVSWLAREGRGRHT